MSEQITVEEAIEEALADAERQEGVSDFDNLSLRDATSAALDAFDDFVARIGDSEDGVTLTAESEDLAILYGLAEGAATYAAINNLAVAEMANLARALQAASQ